MTDLFSSQLRSVVDLMRFDAGLRIRVNRLLAKVQREIISEIAVINPASARLQSVRIRRLKRLSEVASETIDTQFPRASNTMLRELRGLSEFEAARFGRDINSSIGANIFDVTLTEDMLDSLVNKSMISGNTVGQWWNDKATDFKQKFGRDMRQATADFQAGFIKGDSIGALTAKLKGKLGYMSAVKRETEALVRTSIMTVANDVRFKMIEDNEDILSAVQVIATLDMRTTPICQGLDGLMWTVGTNEPIGHSQSLDGGPPFHWNCRSTLVPVTKPWSELAGPNSKLSKKKLDELDKLTRSERASLGKPTNRKTYQTWLKGQPVSVQQEVLGVKRQELWSRNGLTTTQLISQTNRPLTLDQLYDKYELRPKGEIAIVSHAASKTKKVSLTYSVDKKIGGTKIMKESSIAPNDPNYNKTLKIVEQQLAKSSRYLKNAMPDEVRINGVRNPADAYWTKKYKMKAFKSGATGGVEHTGKAVINIWEPKLINPIGLEKTIPHEQAHIMADRLTGSVRLGKWKNKWDHQIHLEGHSSKYAAKSGDVAEDFADYVAGRVNPGTVYAEQWGIPVEGDFAMLFPEKTKIFNEIIKEAK